MFSFLSSLFRLILLGMAGLGMAAILLGRYAPVPQIDPQFNLRSPTPPRYYSLSDRVFPQDNHMLYILDARTGAVQPFPWVEREALDHLSCSPWRDGQGQYHMLGRCRGYSGTGSLRHYQTFGLLRFTLPAGRILNRVMLDPMPAGPPCWNPNARDLVLYAAGDGRLYRYDLPEAEEPQLAPIATQAQPLRWRIDPPGVGEVYLRDPCWPSGPALGGRLILSLNYREDVSRPLTDSQLWWLQLSPDCTEIVAAGRLLLYDGDDAGAWMIDEFLPSVGTANDGSPLLAYLARDRGQLLWALWVAPITAAASGGAPQVLATCRRKLAEGCAGGDAPVFSADGRWVYAARLNERSGIRLERFSVTLAVDEPSADHTSE